MKRSPISRHTPMPRPTKPIERAPMRRRSRKPSEFARIYHSRERVQWIKDLPCIVCVALSPFLAVGECHNAHTVSGGKGRKAGYETIVPLCASHHRRYDEHQPPFDTEAARDAVKGMAPKVEALWQQHQEHMGRVA